MNDGWRKNFQMFSNTEEDFKKALSGLVLFFPVIALGYLVIAVLAAL